MVSILSHNCTVRFWPNMIQVKTPHLPVAVKPAPRGAVSEFSKASRRRMLEMINQVTFERLTFCSMTYPAVWPDDPREWKAHLRAFRARLERKFGKLRVLWRLEFQERGAPHFHLLLLDAPFICRFWLSKAWAQCNRGHSWDNFRYGTNIKGVAKKGENGKIVAYVCKYIAKLPDGESENKHEFTGRYWGRWNVEKITPIEIAVEPGDAVHITAGAISLRGGHSSYVPGDYTACRVFGHRVGSDEFGTVLHDSAQHLAKRE